MNEDLEDSRSHTPDTESNYRLTKNKYNHRQETSTLINLDSIKHLLPIDESQIKVNILKKEAETSTDLYDLFTFFIDFLKKVECMLENGNLSKLLVDTGIMSQEQAKMVGFEAQDSQVRL